MATYAEKIAATASFIQQQQQAKSDRLWLKIDKQREVAERKRLKEQQASAALKRAEVQRQQRVIERANRDAAFVYQQAQQDALREKYRLKRRQLARVTCKIRNNVNSAIRRHKAKKLGTTISLLGCTFKTFKRHIEARFKEGMAWDNHGTVWHIDHVRPCASFNMLDRRQQRQCFSYKNTQPLFVSENLEKGCKY